MKNPNYFNTLLFGALALFASCSGSEDIAADLQPPEQQTWKAIINNATQGNIGYDDTDSQTRALFVGGYTDRFMTAWDNQDVVQVFKGDTKVGEMTPESSSWGTVRATLTGTLTGPFAVNDVLTLYLPSREMDLTGQKGTLQSTSPKTYQTNTITVTEAKDNILTLSNVDMEHRVTYVRFILSDVDTDTRLHPSRLELHAVSGGNSVLTSDALGNTLTTGDVVVVPERSNGEYPGEIYVAILNDNDAVVTYGIKAVVGSDVYVGPLDGSETGYGTYAPNLAIYKGKLRNAIRYLRKTKPVASTLTITDIPEKTFTGYEITPTLTVKDGETTLTLDTDYSVAYTDNTNVGTATATITGLAESGATCTTPYLGTQAKTFSIVQATPVIDMTATTMTLVNNGTQNTATRTVARVFIDNNGNGTWDGGTDYDITALCTVNYSTGNDAVATVNETSGLVTAAGFGTTTITATVVAATNWTTQTATYTVNVEQEVNGQNAVSPWNNGGSEGGKIYVE